MTARININIEADSAYEAREQLRHLLGDTSVCIQGDCGSVEPEPEPVIDNDSPLRRETVAEEVEEQPVRERGKPAPGKARRTKEEIAEDEAADKADAGAAAAEEKPAVSTGEERIDPTSEADAAQDAADEQAEVEQTTTAKLTHDDVRAALKKYLDAYGTAAAMEDGPKVLTLMFGEGKVKVSDVPEDQEALQKAIDGIGEMLAKNPYKREAQL